MNPITFRKALRCGIKTKQGLRFRLSSDIRNQWVFSIGAELYKGLRSKLSES
jgi:hypothetical protein